MGLLTGSASAVVATIAIAAIGLAMFSGKLDARRAMVTVIGCFVLAGAAAIATGIRSQALGRGPIVANTPPIAPPIATPLDAPAYDPYAGAAVPVR